MSDFISEKIIEDILSADRSILAELLSVSPSGLNLLARQKSVESGKLDLLCLYENDLLLIELKVAGFSDDVVDQIDSYHKDLQELQAKNKLIGARIRKIVLVTGAKPEDFDRCQARGIRLVVYRPECVLSKFYENFRELSYFLQIQSGDYGVVRLGLLNSTLRSLSAGKRVGEICRIEGKSEKTIRNRLVVAVQLGLVGKFRGGYFLTDGGNSFLEKSARVFVDRLSDDQVEFLSKFVTENPFYSPATYTILSILEAVFVLAKSAYPVSVRVVQEYFVTSVGKGQAWKTPKARETATYIFSNYACELHLLTKVSNHFYITPKGIQAILLLQLNRSIKLIESQRIGEVSVSAGL